MAMIYGNLSGKSGVHAYDVGADFIEVRFNDGSTYVYTYASTGKSDVEFMKRLASFGHGLNGYITKHIGKRYARKY